jgi:hypothetical protein
MKAKILIAIGIIYNSYLKITFWLLSLASKLHKLHSLLLLDIFPFLFAISTILTQQVKICLSLHQCGCVLLIVSVKLLCHKISFNKRPLIIVKTFGNYCGKVFVLFCFNYSSVCMKLMILRLNATWKILFHYW